MHARALRSLEASVNVTKCIGHPKCIPAGYYPNLSAILIHGMKRAHLEVHAELSIQRRPVQEGEIPLRWSEPSDPQNRHQTSDLVRTKK